MAELPQRQQLPAAAGRGCPNFVIFPGQKRWVHECWLRRGFVCLWSAAVFTSSLSTTPKGTPLAFSRLGQKQMLRSITRTQAMADTEVRHGAPTSQKVTVRRVTSGGRSKAGEAEAAADGEESAGADAVTAGGPEQDHPAGEERQSFDAEIEDHDPDEPDGGDPDLDVDVETLEESGPGQFLIRRNAELLNAIFALRSEVEALRRHVENGNESAADRLVRAIDRASTRTSQQTRQVSRLLVLVALINLVLVGLAVHMYWPFPFLPAPTV